MGEYNKSIEDILKELEDVQISEIVKQVNMNINIGGHVPNPNNYEQGENSNPFNYSSVPRRSRIKKTHCSSYKRRQTINEEFKPRNPLI